jgi:hypothetical protein
MCFFDIIINERSPCYEKVSLLFVRKLLEEREEAQARAELLDRRFREHFAQFASILKFESISGGVPTPEEIIRQVC